MEFDYLTAPARASPWPLLVRTAVVAGTIAAVVEMAPVLGIQGAALNVSPVRVFQSIASGVLGAPAYRGGLATLVAGVALHWLISVSAALTFAWTATRWRDLVVHPVLVGLGFGVLAFAVMTALVVPLSAAAFPPNRNPALILVSLTVHMVFFGLPIALATRWWWRRGGGEGWSMPKRERLDGFVAAVVQGRFVQAQRDYYHDDAVTRENSGPERRGLPTLIAIEEGALKAFAIRAHPPGAVLLDGDRVAIHWTFDITDQEGMVRRMDEIALQRWRGDRIAEERFFYDPNLSRVKEGLPQ